MRSRCRSPSPQTGFVPFSATTRLSGVDLGQRKLRKGAVDAILKFAREEAGSGVAEPPAFRAAVERIARSGGTPLGLAEGGRLLGVVHLKDVVKADIKERFAQMRRMGIKTVMITGDNPVTAAAIASEAGVDDFVAEATPEDKLRYIRNEQAQGRLIAMCGDGTNDAPALAQADVAVAMQTGTQAAREAGNMVDLDSNPTKLIEIVEIGKQLLMTRGSLTTFSIANDVAKYFAIIPALVRRLAAGARRAQRHGARHAAQRHSVGGDLQCAHHRRAHPAGAEGRRLPSDRSGCAAAAQSAGLRARRPRRALHRHQADRSCGRRPRSCLEWRKAMLRQLRAPLVMLLGFTLITGLIYPLAVSGFAWIMMHDAALGSLVVKDGKVVGSSLVGQDFASARYFHPRPSATDPPYNAAASSGSNLGPITQKLLDRTKASVDALREQGVAGPIPVDAVTASASGLDPDISPETRRAAGAEGCQGARACRGCGCALWWASKRRDARSVSWGSRTLTCSRSISRSTACGSKLAGPRMAPRMPDAPRAPCPLSLANALPPTPCLRLPTRSVAGG